VSLAAVVLSCLLLAAGYFLSWADKLQEVEQLKHNAISVRERPKQWQAELAELPALTRRASELEAKVQASRKEKKLKSDPPTPAAMQKKLQKEWRGLTNRPGLKVAFKDQQVPEGVNYELNPYLAVEMKATGPKDELFRLLDGLLRQSRPVRLNRLDLECGPDRGQADILVEVYYAPQ
jgi:Tfp pilus assembly protein PilO